MIVSFKLLIIDIRNKLLLLWCVEIYHTWLHLRYNIVFIALSILEMLTRASFFILNSNALEISMDIIYNGCILQKVPHSIDQSHSMSFPSTCLNLSSFLIGTPFSIFSRMQALGPASPNKTYLSLNNQDELRVILF